MPADDTARLVRVSCGSAVTGAGSACSSSSPWRRLIGDVTGPTTTDTDIAAPAWLPLECIEPWGAVRSERSIDVDQVVGYKTPATGGAEFDHRRSRHATPNSGLRP